LDTTADEGIAVVVKFVDDSLVSVDSNGAVRAPNVKDGPSLNAIFAQFSEFKFQRLHSSNEDSLTALRFCAFINTGADQADMTSFFFAPLGSENRQAAVILVRQLLDHPLVETAYFRPKTVLPAADIAPPTPSSPRCS